MYGRQVDCTDYLGCVYFSDKLFIYLPQLLSSLYICHNRLGGGDGFQSGRIKEINGVRSMYNVIN